MHKIANANELESELRRLLAYSHSDSPSRSRIASELQTLSAALSHTKVAGAFDSENKTQLSALKKHLKSALDDTTKAEALVIELEKAARGNKALERRFDGYRSWVTDAALNFTTMHRRLERGVDED